jgi:hypothetical protein
MASAAAAAAADGRDTVKKLRHLGRKLSKNLASSVDNLLELLDVMYLLAFHCLIYLYLSAGFVCHEFNFNF